MMNTPQSIQMTMDDLREGRISDDTITAAYSAIHRGYDPSIIVELIHSKNKSIEEAGLYLLYEFAGTFPENVNKALLPTVTEFSEQDPYKRMLFVRFFARTLITDDKILNGLVRCLGDDSAVVRGRTISWWLQVLRCQEVESVIKIVVGQDSSNKDDLDDFLAAADIFDRKSRGLRIALLARKGIEWPKIAETVPYEDSFTFDLLRKREKKRKSKDVSS